MTTMRSQHSLPGQAPGAFQFYSYPQSHAPSTALAPKRKLPDNNEDDDAIHRDSLSVPTHPQRRIVVDEFGNRVLVDGIKRMRVSSPLKTLTPTAAPCQEDIAMDDDTDSDADATTIVPLRMAHTNTTKTPTLVKSAQQAMHQFAAVDTPPAWSDAYDPSCRALVLFDPHHTLTVERSPRIQLVHSDSDKTEPSDDDVEEPFVRFEELPDDYEVAPEAMELD